MDNVLVQTSEKLERLSNTRDALKQLSDDGEPVQDKLQAIDQQIEDCQNTLIDQYTARTEEYETS